MTRLLGFTLALALCCAPVASAQRQRSVRVPSPDCSFTLAPQYASPVADAGLLRGLINVTPSAANCSSFGSAWGAFSPVDWIMFEPGPQDAPMSIAITVAPNGAPDVRSATVRIAGVEHQVTQLGRATLIDVGLLRNGTFDRDIEPWAWQDRFPNGVGFAAWSSLDANGNGSSGSLQLRNTALAGPGFQRLQCVTGIVPFGAYTLTAAVRSGPSSAGIVQMVAIDLESTDCSGPYTWRVAPTVRGDGVTWKRVSESFRVGPNAHSMLIVVAAKTNTNTPFDAYFDDLVLRAD